MPSATLRVSHASRALDESGSAVSVLAVTPPSCEVVPLEEVSDHVTFATPSAVLAFTVSTTDPLTLPDCGATLNTTGLDVAATHCAFAVCAFVSSGPDAITGTIWYE